MHLYIAAKAWIPIVDPVILKSKMQTKNIYIRPNIVTVIVAQNNINVGGSVVTSLRKTRPEFGTYAFTK